MTHEKQFSYEIAENGHVLDSREIDDPFVRTTIIPKGFKTAWQVLRGKLKFTVRVDGTREANRVIFGGDYTPQPAGPPRLACPSDTCNIQASSK